MDQRDELIACLRQAFDEYEVEPYAIYRAADGAPLPNEADSETVLKEHLENTGRLIPLPKEPAALANIVEVSLVDFLIATLGEQDDVDLTRGTERGYPDLELAGERFGGIPYAIDIKVAKRKASARTGRVNESRTQSRITLYTGNTYFR